MELTQVRSEEPLLQNVQRSRTPCFHWLSVCSFVLLLGTTIILALLHFQVFKTDKKDEFELEVPEVLQIKTYLESAPKTQAMNGKRAAAHLIGKKVQEHIEWQPKPANAFQDGSIKLVKNSLEIQEDGLYFVYTQVVFTGRNCQKNHELNHSIHRKSSSDNESVVILKSSKTVCEVKSDSSWTQPIYQGGILKLEVGDILYTETSNIKFLDANHGQVYFGILAV